MPAKPRESNGSVYYNKQRNTWTASYYIKDLETGKNKRATKSFPTQESARTFLNELLYQRQDIIFIKNNGIPLIEVMKSLLQKKLDSNLITDRAYARIKDTLRIIEKCYLANQNVNEISTEEIQNYFNSLSNIYSNSSIEKIFFEYKKAFEFCLNKGYIHQNPMYEVIKPKSLKEDKLLEALEVDEQQKLTDYLISANIRSMPYKNVLFFQMYLGLRVGEALALKKSDFDLQKKLLTVQRTLTTDKNDKVCIGKSTKTFSGKRELPIPDFLLPYVLEQIEESKNHVDNLLFTTPEGGLVLHSTINRILKQISKKVGINKDISTHILRHTYGTRCIESGMRAVALQRLLGHSSINVTLDSYTSILNKYKEDELQKVNNYYINNQIFDTNKQSLFYEPDTEFDIEDER